MPIEFHGASRGAFITQKGYTCAPPDSSQQALIHASFIAVATLQDVTGSDIPALQVQVLLHFCKAVKVMPLAVVVQDRTLCSMQWDSVSDSEHMMRYSYATGAALLHHY